MQLDGLAGWFRGYKVSKHLPQNKQATIRGALLIFGVAVQSVAVASRMSACTCTKTIEIEFNLSQFAYGTARGPEDYECLLVLE